MIFAAAFSNHAKPALTPPPIVGGHSTTLSLLQIMVKIKQMAFRMQTEQVEEELQAWSIKKFFAKRDVQLLFLAIFLFHLSNGAIFPLASLVMADISVDDGKAREALVFTTGTFACAKLFRLFGVASYELVSRRLGIDVVVILSILCCTVRAGMCLTFLYTTDNRYAIASTAVIDGLGMGWNDIALELLIQKVSERTGKPRRHCFNPYPDLSLPGPWRCLSPIHEVSRTASYFTEHTFMIIST